MWTKVWTLSHLIHGGLPYTVKINTEYKYRKNCSLL